MTIVSFDEAKNLLTNLPPNVTIELTKLPTGGFVVFPVQEMTKTKDQIIEEKFSGLRKQSIRLSDAAKQYKVSTANLTRWMQAGYIKAEKQVPYNTLLNEADVAYCAHIYHERKKQGATFGSRLFDEKGNPYELKHPNLAKRRRRQKN
jgi:hypothetical protein